MSYLPRMSKTYKEPEERTEDQLAKEVTFNSIPIASAQPDQKSYNPQSVLKQYRYFPHPPPILPGPSLIQEAEENEKISIDARRRRSRGESEEKISTLTTENVEEYPFESNNEKPTINFALLEIKPMKIDQEQSAPNISRKVVKSNKTPRKGLLKVNKNKEDNIKAVKFPVTNETAGTEPSSPQKPKKKHSPHTNDTIPAANENPIKHRSNHAKNIKPEECILGDNKEVADFPVISVKGSIHEGVQCTLMSGSEKIFVMPSCIHFLMKTLSFLVQELSRSESDEESKSTKEAKKLISQINEAVNSLSNRKIDNSVTLITSLSDRKRLEKICCDLEQYIQDLYGKNGKLGCMSVEKKKLYCKLLQKEYELNILNEKLRESEIQNPSFKQIDLMAKPAEVILQNKTLENEQLRAEVEFNAREMKKFHQTLAEKNWEIHANKEEISAFKKKLATLKLKTKK